MWLVMSSHLVTVLAILNVFLLQRYDSISYLHGRQDFFFVVHEQYFMSLFGKPVYYWPFL